MKYRVIFENGHFIGYATNKQLLSNFLNNRKGKYKIKKVDESEIPEEIKNSFDFTNYELVEYTNYHTDNDTILFNYEYVDMEDHMVRDALMMQHLALELIHCLNVIRLTDDERKIIQYSLYRIFDDLKAITDTNEVIFDEIFDIRKYFYKRYLPNRRDTKDIVENSVILDY